MFTVSFTVLGSNTLKKIVDLVKDQGHITEAVVRVNESGFHFQSMDTCQVALADCSIHFSTSTESVSVTENCSLGIHFDTLSKILKCVTARDSVTLSYKDGDFLELLVYCNGEKRGSFKLRLIDFHSDPMDIPDSTDLYQLDSTEFQCTMKDIASFSDETLISEVLGGLSLTASGDTSEASLVVKAVKTGSECGVVDNHALFSTKYLLWFSKASVLGPHILLSIGNESPLMLQCTNEQATLKFFLAPKIQ